MNVGLIADGGNRIKAGTFKTVSKPVLWLVSNRIRY